MSMCERFLQVQKSPDFSEHRLYGSEVGACWIVMCTSLLEASDLSAVDLRRPAVRVWTGLGRSAGSAWREPLFRIRQIHGNPAFLKITTTALVILFTRLGGINDNLTDLSLIHI